MKLECGTPLNSTSGIPHSEHMWSNAVELQRGAPQTSFLRTYVAGTPVDRGVRAGVELHKHHYVRTYAYIRIIHNRK